MSVRSTTAFVSQGSRVPDDALYTFYLSSDDGAKLRIEARLSRTTMGAGQGQIALRRGPHPVEVVFFQATGPAKLRPRGLHTGLRGSSLVPGEWFAHRGGRRGTWALSKRSLDLSESSCSGEARAQCRGFDSLSGHCSLPQRPLIRVAAFVRRSPGRSAIRVLLGAVGHRALFAVRIRPGPRDHPRATTVRRISARAWPWQGDAEVSQSVAHDHGESVALSGDVDDDLSATQGRGHR